MQSYNFWFFTIFGNWSCDHTPDHPIVHMLFLFIFWSNQITFPFWGICRGPWHGPWQQCIQFCLLQTSKLPFLDMYTEPWKQHQKYQQQCLSFSDYSLFYSFFLSRNANISIFRNVHWFLKTVPPHHHPSPISPPEISPILLLFFILHSHIFHIWKCTLDPETAHHPYFSAILLVFFIFKSAHFLFWKWLYLVATIAEWDTYQSAMKYWME